jgi:putative FmdB family regulatory protein
MPIYAYKCESCGFAKDVLQKMSDAPLSDCPTCGVSAFKKQLTAAGFQLKGSGWYATDFKGGAAAKSNTSANPESTPTAVAEGTKPAESSAVKQDTATPSASGACGGACACH